MNFIVPCIGNVIIPTDEVHHFSEGLVETTNQEIYLNTQMLHGAGIFTYIYPKNGPRIDLGVGQPPTSRYMCHRLVVVGFLHFNP